MNTRCLLMLLLFFAGCSPAEDKEKEVIVATLGNDPIYEKEIDSLLTLEADELKKRTLEALLERKIFLAESKRRKISIDSLLQIEVIKKAREISSADLNRYVERYHINTKQKHAVDIISELKALKKKEKKEEYLAYLKQQHLVNMLICPQKFTYVNVDSIPSFPINKYHPNKITTYIVYDFENPLCIYMNSHLEKIILKYSNKVNFAYIYFSKPESKTIAAMDAANKQKKLVEMHRSIGEHYSSNLQNMDYVTDAKKIQLDLKKFKTDMQQYILTKQKLPVIKTLAKHGIIAAPAFIVNHQLLSEPNSIDYLDSFILRSISQK